MTDDSAVGAPVQDHDWLTDLFGRHSAAVLGYARRRLDSAEDAEDVVVEVFATAWRRRDVVPADPLPWLYATAANVIAHVIRTDGRRTRLGARLASVSALRTTDPDVATAVVDSVAAGGVVSAALDDLAESDAEILRLWAWEQLEPAEIALVVGCSPGTARTRLHRARGRLRQALALRGVQDAALDGEQSPEHRHPSIATPEVPGAASTHPATPGTPDDDQEAWR